MPSIPGAPLLLLAIWYASCRVSILQTWTYSPQKRQVGSAFALTYILLLRSCKLMGAFVISPLPPICWSSCTTAGPLRSTGITRFFATTGPSATLSSSTDFPVLPVIRLLFRGFLPRDEEGFSSCLMCPCHLAVAIAPPDRIVASVSLCNAPYCLHPLSVGSASGF